MAVGWRKWGQDGAEISQQKLKWLAEPKKKEVYIIVVVLKATHAQGRVQI